jgi:glycosyltransferase 2 family protein
VRPNLKNILSFTLSLSLGIIILYLVFQQQQNVYESTCDIKTDPNGCSLVKKTMSEFSEANWFFMLLAITFSLLSNVFRALRWNLLTEPMGYPIRFFNAFGAILIGYFTSLAIPRIGEFMRAGVLAKYERMPTEKAFGTVILERVVDVIIFAIVGLLVFLVAYKDISSYLIAVFQKYTDKSWESLFSLTNILLLLGAVVLGIFIILYFRKAILRSKFGHKVANFFNGLLEGLTSISKLQKRSLFVIYSFSIWVCYFLMVYVAFFAYEPTAHLGFKPALAVLLFGSLGMFIPSPAGMGSFQWLVSQSLNIYGVASVNGFTYGNLHFFAVAICSTIVFGLSSYIFLPIYNQVKQKS